MGLLLAGCSTTIESPGEQGLTPAQKLAQERWLQQALPVFKTSCTMCHDGSMPAVGYLQGMTDLGIRDTLLAFTPAIVNLTAPQSSRVLTKGMHEGPALSAQQASDVLAWVTAQRDATPPMPGPETAQMMAMPCTSGAPGTANCPINTVDLTAVGTAGSSITFVAAPVGSDLYVTEMTLKAGAAGAYIEHPLFVAYPAAPAKPTPDPIDQLFAVKLNLMANASAKLGDGTATFTGFSTSNPLTIQFTAVDNYRP